MELLNTAVNGRLVLVVPVYSQAQTTLEYEEVIAEMRKPYQKLVQQGFLEFESRHGVREMYRLTTKALDVLQYRSNCP